jgi:hypothetical protein
MKKYEGFLPFYLLLATIKHEKIKANVGKI